MWDREEELVPTTHFHCRCHQPIWPIRYGHASNCCYPPPTSQPPDAFATMKNRHLPTSCFSDTTMSCHCRTHNPPHSCCNKSPLHRGTGDLSWPWAPPPPRQTLHNPSNQRTLDHCEGQLPQSQTSRHESRQSEQRMSGQTSVCGARSRTQIRYRL